MASVNRLAQREWHGRTTVQRATQEAKGGYAEIKGGFPGALDDRRPVFPGEGETRWVAVLRGTGDVVTA